MPGGREVSQRGTSANYQRWQTARLTSAWGSGMSGGRGGRGQCKTAGSTGSSVNGLTGKTNHYN